MTTFYHGLIGDHRHFSSTIAALAGQVGACHVPDIDYLNTDYIDLLKKHVVRPTAPSVRIGNSIGCSLAVELAGPEDELILTAPPFDYGKGIVPLGKGLASQWLKGLYVRHGLIANETVILENAARQIQGLLCSRNQIKRLRQYKAQAQAFWENPKLQTHQGRITFVIGDQDFTTPPDAFVEAVSKAIPRAKVEIWQRCGHAVPLDAPKKLGALVRHRKMRLEMNSQNLDQTA